LTTAFPESSFDDIHKLYPTWNEESLAIAKDAVYNNINEGDLPSDSYIAAGKIVAERQIAKAGYRLANLLSGLWKTKKSIEEEEAENII
jgi:hypothetical protein